jgi:hypothetical protein
MGKPVPPRLSFLLASEAPVGLIFRRGPSRVVRIIHWNRKRDTFRYCQHFRGRIFVEDSHISPDGRHWIYFAMGGVAWAIPDTGGTWTAIARVPSLTALTLWAIGGTRLGQGVFTSNNSYWVSLDPTSVCLRDESRLRRDDHPPKNWLPLQEHKLRHGWILRRVPRGYQLEQPEDNTVIDCPKWEWAGWDRDRLAWTESGYLRAARLGAHKLGTIHTLADFNEAPA